MNINKFAVMRFWLKMTRFQSTVQPLLETTKRCLEKIKRKSSIFSGAAFYRRHIWVGLRTRSSY